MPHNIKNIVINAQKFMQDNNIDGWLLYDYHGMNPIFRETVGEISNVTRPCWLWIPQKDTPELIVSYVDQNRFEHLKIKTTFWVSKILLEKFFPKKIKAYTRIFQQKKIKNSSRGANLRVLNRIQNS